MSIYESRWMKISWWSIRKATYLTWLSLIGVIIIGVTAAMFYVRSLPELSTWHTVQLKHDFDRHCDVHTFESYLKLEDQLFKELDSEVYNKVLPDEKNRVNRYTRDSYADPKRWPKNWNRSFELPVKNPKAGVLLLHGMSDSPYSLHVQAEMLQKKGVWVVAMRLPGHGTIPSGLRSISWKDLAEVVEIGMKHLKEKVGEKEIHIIGYSTGASLALNYTFDALKDESLVLPKSLIFYSPAIGVSKAAPLAVWQSRIGHLLGLPKLEWNSIEPEYDPFKYNSFAVNAGDQVYRICKKVQEQFDDYEKNQKQNRPFPSVLSFQSIIDNTVSVTDTINHLYKRLPKGDHTLVLFDINNNFNNNLLVKKYVHDKIEDIKTNSTGQNYTLDLISDMNSSDDRIKLIRNKKVIKELPYIWPKNLFSLSHVAMPISKNDPLYGNINAPKSPGVTLGHLAMYGESSVLQISPSAILRQRWNPFYDYTQERMLDFLGL